MAKSQRRGNKEARKPKTAKPISAAPVSPFGAKSAAAATQPAEAQGLKGANGAMRFASTPPIRSVDVRWPQYVARRQRR